MAGWKVALRAENLAASTVSKKAELLVDSWVALMVVQWVEMLVVWMAERLAFLTVGSTAAQLVVGSVEQ